MKTEPGQILKQERLSRGWTQKYVAQKLGFPDSTYISRIESGKRKISTEELRAFAKLFNIGLDYLLFGGEEINYVQKTIPINDSYVLEFFAKKGRITKEQEERIQSIKDEDMLLGILPDHDIDFFLKPANCNKFIQVYNLKDSEINADEVLEAALEVHSSFMVAVNNTNDNEWKSAYEITWEDVIKFASEIGVTPRHIHSMLRTIKQIVDINKDK